MDLGYNKDTRSFLSAPVAAPVYWANVPASVKNLFDRLLGTAMEETNTFPKPRLRGKQYMILTSCNTPAPFSWIFGQSRGAIRSMDEFFKTAGMKSAGKVVCANAKNKKELPKRTMKKNPVLYSNFSFPYCFDFYGGLSEKRGRL